MENDMEKKMLVSRSEIVKILQVVLEPWMDESALLSEKTDLLSDVGLDSVAILQLVLGVEKEFNITIKDYELDSEVFAKMANLIDIIEGKINEAN